MFDDRLMYLRKSKKLSMKAVAEQLELPYTTYINYEKNLREPPYNILIKISKFYRVSIDYLVDNDTIPLWVPINTTQSAFDFMYKTMAYDFEIPELFCIELDIPLDTLYRWRTQHSLEFLIYYDRLLEYLNLSYSEFAEKFKSLYNLDYTNLSSINEFKDIVTFNYLNDYYHYRIFGKIYTTPDKE